MPAILIYAFQARFVTIDPFFLFIPALRQTQITISFTVRNQGAHGTMPSLQKPLVEIV